MAVFKQKSSGSKGSNKVSPDQKSFTGSAIGQGSTIVDLGAVKGWKDIQKGIKAKDSVGFVVYIDGTAYLAANFESQKDKLSVSDKIIVAIDTKALPKDLADELEFQIKSRKNTVATDLNTGLAGKSTTGAAILARRAEQRKNLSLADHQSTMVRKANFGSR